MNQKNRIVRSFTLCIILTVILSVLLYILSFILFYAIEPVSIDLNGGEPVIEVRDVPYMPGMVVEKPFYIENDGSQAVYYRLYLDNVSGELADLVEVAVLNGNTVLYEGKAKELSRVTTRLLTIFFFRAIAGIFPFDSDSPRMQIFRRAKA